MSHQRLSRRSWMQSGLGAVAGLTASAALLPGAAADDGLPADLDIIDCHTHFYDPSRPQGVPWPDPKSTLYRTVLPQHLREQPQYRPPRFKPSTRIRAAFDHLHIGAKNLHNSARPDFARKRDRSELRVIAAHKKTADAFAPTVGSSLTICFTQPVAVCAANRNVPGCMFGNYNRRCSWTQNTNRGHG